jgi:hypothetical protein
VVIGPKNGHSVTWTATGSGCVCVHEESPPGKKHLSLSKTGRSGSVPSSCSLYVLSYGLPNLVRTFYVLSVYCMFLLKLCNGRVCAVFSPINGSVCLSCHDNQPTIDPSTALDSNKNVSHHISQSHRNLELVEKPFLLAWGCIAI